MANKEGGPASRQGGLIKLILIFIILIITLSYFGIDIRGIVESERTQQNFSYAWSLATTIWYDYLADPITYFWNNIFISLLWTSFIDNLERVKQGEPHDFILNAPSVDFSAPSTGQ
jgi:hypothetical protein